MFRVCLVVAAMCMLYRPLSRVYYTPCNIQGFIVYHLDELPEEKGFCFENVEVDMSGCIVYTSSGKFVVTNLHVTLLK